MTEAEAVMLGMAAVCVAVAVVSFWIGLKVGFDDGVKFGSKIKTED